MRQRSFSSKYDDMLGQIRSAQTGGTAWTIAGINDTSFQIGWLANNSTDMFQLTIQAPHRRLRDSVLADIHVHYILESAATAAETITWDTKYCWIQPGGVVPAIGSWTTSSITSQVLATTNAFYYGIFNLAVNVAAPTAPEGYGSMLLIKVSRGNGTHTGRIGILDADAHSLMDKL